jgi:ABC-type uncharacterized transport system permease subunit
MHAGMVINSTQLENIFAQHLIHKAVLSLLTWLVFGVLLWGR